ncbi:MAG TPA: glycosyltransferase [Syntrophorhabdaceae bacterium]|nr:glycosyltransferase [Syntrophorhabdaceae bacterium]
MVSSTPKISIGMPVYNGEKYIRKALDSLLRQTFTDFELIISDNASTDRTREICLEYAKKDNRIRYYRNQENIGAAKNFNRLIELSSGEFFMWAGDHDMWDKTFLSRCLEVLMQNKNAVLCYAKAMIIGPDDNFLCFSPTSLDTSNLDNPWDRFRKTIHEAKFCDMIYGLIRLKALKETSGIATAISPDYLLLAELSLKGSFVQIPDALFSMRQNRPGETQHEAEKRQIEFMWPGRKRFLSAHVILQYIILMFRQLNLVRNTSFSFKKKLWLITDTISFFISHAKFLERISNAIFKKF